jgi:biopolymer transport protein ExbD
VKKWLEELLEEHVGMQIAPLIDVVFLLLIYFLVTSSLKKQETDLGILLPGRVEVSAVVQMPDEQIIEIDERGRVSLNAMIYTRQADGTMPELAATLRRYREAATFAGTRALVTIEAHADSVHQRTIDAMNACAAAGIRHVTVAMGD